MRTDTPEPPTRVRCRRARRAGSRALLTQVRAAAEGLGMLANDVAREIEVLWHPVAHRRQVLAERQRNNVLGVANEDGAVAHAGVPLDVADHLGVVVGGQERLMVAPRWHGHVPDEVGEPGEPGSLQLGVLVPVVVDVPGFVGNDEIVAARVDGILEDHEIGDQHLVHASDRLEAVQIVLTRLQLDVPRLACKPRTQRVDALAAGLKQTRHGVLRQPIDLQGLDAACATLA